jgi:hypothetical protein
LALCNSRRAGRLRFPLASTVRLRKATFSIGYSPCATNLSWWVRPAAVVIDVGRMAVGHDARSQRADLAGHKPVRSLRWAIRDGVLP